MALQSCLLAVLNNVAHEKENPSLIARQISCLPHLQKSQAQPDARLFSFIYYPANEVIYAKSAVTPSQARAVWSLFLI